MAKVIKTVVLVAAAVALVAFAAPIAGFVAGTLSITAAATIASIATVVTSIGLTLGATALMGLFRKTPSIPNATVERLNSTVVPAAPRKIVFGETAAGNDIRFAETSGSKKDRYDCVIALASHRINSVKAVHFENNLAWSGSIQSKFSKGLVGVRHVLEGKASNAIAVGSGSYWNSTSTFTGCAYMALRYKLDGELWPEGIPQRITTIVEGCPLYDPRRDSSNGGTGPHRIADQSTWAFHADGVAIGRNPALALLTYLIGYRIAGKLVWGMGVPVSRINFDSFRSYANLCEERVALQAGGTVQRYTCDGILSTADSHEACINAITAAMGSCKMVDTGGQYSIIGGFDDTLGLKVHFTADDLVAPAGSTQPYVWVPAPPVRETYNSARGKFADPASLYQLVEWGTIETETLADGIERQMTVDLAMVSRPETCQRIASQFLLREAKTPGIFSAVFGPRAFSAQVGSLVTLSLPAQGWNRKLFRVLDQAESHDLVFQMTLREESSEVYAWDREEKPLPANIRPEGYDPTDVLAVEGLAATTTTSVGASSYETSDISVTWTPQDSGRVAGIQIEARPVGVTVWSEIAALHSAAAGELAFQSVRPGARIEIRARYRMATAVYGPWATVTINSAPAKVDWTDAISGEGKPENGATKGGVIGVDVINPDGTIFVPPVADVDMDKVRAEIDREIAETKTAIDADIASAKESASNARTEAGQARSDAAAASAQAAQVRTDLVPTIAAARKAGTDASAEAATVRDNLAAEVSRAQGVEGTLSTRITTAHGRADAAHTAISEETTQRANADTALSNRTNTVEAKLAGTVDSELAARIRAEETARVAADNVVAARTSVVEASYGRVADVIDNGHFDAGFDGWVRFGASVVVPSSYGRSNVVRTVKGARLDSIWGRRYTLKSRDQRFKLSASLRCAEGTSRYYAGAVFFDADGNYVAANDGTGNYPLGSGYDLNSATHGWLDRSVIIGQGLGYYSDFGGSCGIPDAAKYFRPILFINYLDDPNSVTEVDYFTVEDVTENVATNARLSVEETARSTADTALANRLSTTEAQLNWSIDSELGRNIRVVDAKVVSEETARVSADAALATRNTSLEAKFNSSADRRSMTVGADTFVGGGIGDPSLLPSAGTLGLTGTYGPHVEFGTANASLRAVSPLGRTNQTYKLRARLWQTGGAPTYVLWYADYLDGSYNRVGTALIGAWQNIDNYFLQTLDREWTSSFIEDAVYIRFSVLLNRSPSDPGANTVPGATTRVLEASVENVSTVRAADAATNARITAEETARSNADSAIANRTSALEAQMNDTSDSWLRARIREEATARADADSAIANRASNLEAQFRGEQGSALKTLIDAGKNNLAQTDWWKAGAGIVWPQSSGENQIYTFPDGQRAWGMTAPDGNSGDIWLCRATGTDAGGGWNAGKSVRLDPDKTYRFTIPIAQLADVRRYSYWGTDNVCELNTGTHHPNPYFAVMGMNQPNRWYLFVGYIFPRNSQNKTNEGAGVWDMVTGEKVADGANYCFNPDGRQPDFRAYQYYTTPGTYQAFGRPLIECVDGSESNFSNAFKAIKQARAADARITVEETTRANADSALANRLATTEAQFRREVPSTLNNTVHALELENVNRLNSIVAADARITSEETTRANADSALANRLSTTEAQFRREIASPLNTTVDSLVNANDYRYREIIQTNTRITNEETTRANADSALGSRISTVEASYVTQSQLRVSDMDLHFDAHIPANDAWSPNVYGTGTLDARITKTVAWNSVSCLYWGVQGGAEVYSRKTIPVDPSRKYRMKARFGAWNNGATGNGDRFYIGFVGIDAYGNVLNHSPNGTYRYSVCPGEVIVDGNIVERSVIVTGEGNDSLLKFPPGTRQIRLLIFMNYDGRAVSSYVDYFTIEEVTEVDTRVSEEATARANADSALASRTNLLEGQISGANDSYVLARLRNEETARANADSALVSRTNALEAQMNDTSDSWLRARIREEASARADADSALSTRSTNLEARAGNVESRVSTTEGAISNLNGRSAAYWQVEAVAGGRARLRAYADNYGSAIDIAADQVYLGNKRTLAIENDRATITGDLYAGNGRIIMDNGTVMKVAGTGFGSANQFIEWFGPRQTNLANCTEANATYYLKTNGSAYFGGALSAGVIKNSVQTTVLIGTANVTTGTFSSNGGSRVITVGYTGSGYESVSGSCPAHYTPYAKIRLYRGTDANGTFLTEQQINGYHECEPATRSGATTEPGSQYDSIGGSFTYTDNSGGSSTSYFVQIVDRVLRGAVSQSLSLTSVEG